MPKQSRRFMEHCTDSRRLTVERKKSCRKIISVTLSLYSPIINFIRQTTKLQQWTIVFFGHCTLCFLRANDLFLTAAHRKHHRGLEDVEDEERKAKETRLRACVHARWIDEEQRNTIQELPRDRSQEVRDSPRLASVVTRECAIIALRTRCWRAFQAHVGLRLSS